MNEFTRVFNELGMTKTELTTLLNAPRNTIFNYLNGSVTNMPASAVTLITLLAFIKQHHPRAFEEWGKLRVTIRIRRKEMVIRYRYLTSSAMKCFCRGLFDMANCVVSSNNETELISITA